MIENVDSLNEHVKNHIKHNEDDRTQIKKYEYEAELSHVQEKMAKFKQDLINEINEKTERFKLDLENLLNKNRRDLTSIEKSAAISKIRKDGSREKVFEYRESLLTELFKISHIRTLRHIFISILIIICIQILVYDYTTYGKLNLDFELFNWSFRGFLVETMLCTWLPMQLSSLILVFYSFKFWATSRESVKSKIYDCLFLILYIIYLSAIIVLPLYTVPKVSIACRFIILIEQVRILMKSYGFVRSNISRALKFKIDSDKNDSHKPKMSPCPPFSKYLYFMFAPTLVYQDQYPRTKRINWKLVLHYFMEIIACIIYAYCLFDRFCLPVFRSINIRSLNLKLYIQLITMCILPGALIQLITFFSFLHCWHNAWAEMLRFGDRQFYLDWWNSTSFNVYYRTWNTLVQDWLYTYIYRDMYKLFGKKFRPLCQFSVIFISSVFHEHILSFAFGFFYPIMFILFSGFGFICLFIPRAQTAFWNVFIWTSIFTGLGIQICLFGIEYFARETNQCPKIIDSFVDYLIPRSLYCTLFK